MGENMKVNILREKYPTFKYHDFVIIEGDNQLKIVYHFEIVGLAHFRPYWIFPKPSHKTYQNAILIKKCAMDLGMVELISYWKLTCSPSVEIMAGYLNEEQCRFFKNVYFHGLGEFFHINQIKLNKDDFLSLKVFGKSYEGDELYIHPTGNLIPIGGGKDSVVTLSLLKDEDNMTYIINQIKSAMACNEVAGYSKQLISPKRVLDSKLLELNKEGYLNGHTPFSAIVAFSSFLAAILFERKYICLSNEASANESTIKGESINHQYSKTFAFESDFDNYTRHYLTDKIHYFSFLRALSELQITRIFSTLTPYHSVFRSCNVKSKVGEWCGHCAKCLFVAVMLSAYLDDQLIQNIFKTDILNDMTLLSLLYELCGIHENKPFECVGTREEVNQAIQLAIERRERLPLLYQSYLDKKMPIIEVKETFNDENLIPEQYVSLIKKKLEETLYE